MNIETLPDSYIRLMMKREDGVEYFAIGQKITVSFRGNDKYLCHKCVKNECDHTERVRKFRAEHPE